MLRPVRPAPPPVLVHDTSDPSLPGRPTTHGSLPATSLSTFLATLAQISAGLVVFLMAAAISYDVFVSDRRATLEDESERLRFDIRNQLNALAVPWMNGHIFSMVPVEVEKALRSNYAGLAGSELLNAISGDLVFMQNDRLMKSLAAAPGRTGTRDTWIRGQLYVWIGHEAVGLLTRKLLSSTPRSDRVFPSVASPGFEPWRKDYEALRPTLTILTEWVPLEVRRDFAASLAVLPEWQARSISEQVTGALNQLSERRRVIDERLRMLEQIEMMASRYRSGPIGRPLFFAAMLAAFVCGVVGPMLLVAMPGYQNHKAVLALSALTLATLVLGSWQLLFALTSGLRVAEGDYEIKRWHAPLLAVVGRDAARLNALGPLDTRALDETSVGVSSPSVRESLSSYRTAAEKYNAIQGEISAQLLAVLESDNYVGSLPKPTLRSGGGLGLSVMELLSRSTILERFRHWDERSFQVFSIGSQPTSNTSRDNYVVSGDLSKNERARLLTYLQQLSLRACSMAGADQLGEARRLAETRRSELARRLAMSVGVPLATGHEERTFMPVCVAH